MVERLDKVCPVKVGVDSEHLTEDGLADFHKVLGKARPLADPVRLAGAGQLREGRGRDAGVVCVRHARRICWENLGVVNLAGYPSLHKLDVLKSRKLDGFSPTVQPSEGVISGWNDQPNTFVSAGVTKVHLPSC